MQKWLAALMIDESLLKIEAPNFKEIVYTEMNGAIFKAHN